MLYTAIYNLSVFLINKLNNRFLFVIPNACLPELISSHTSVYTALYLYLYICSGRYNFVAPKNQTPSNKGDRRGGVPEQGLYETESQMIHAGDSRAPEATMRVTKAADTNYVIGTHGEFKDVVD